MDHADTAAAPFEPFPETALDGSIVDRFDAIVRRFPNRLAVSDATRSLTYLDLAFLVEQFALAVTAAVDERSGPVATFRANDVHYAAATLGIAAAGRSHIPMDADYPIERNRLIASHAGVAAVVTSGDLVDQVRNLVPYDIPIVDIATVQAAPILKSRRRPGPNDLAHILYTSGSIGVPKGVYQNHRGRLHAVLQRTNTLRLSHDDRLALFHSPSTVDGARVTMAALLNGASLHIFPPTNWSLPALAKEIRTRGITVLHSVPTLFRRLATALTKGERFDSVRIVHLSGERVDWSDLHLVKRCCGPGARLAVALGSTESSASYLQWFVDEEIEQTSSQLPIGRDVAGFRLTITDHEGRAVADGTVGEIVVASRYLALGYWHNPELTARVFAVDPADPDLRMLKTGDLARRRPDGLLDFLGRKDHQIKLRGHRIELGEIESIIRECQGVRDAAVLVRHNKEGEPRSLAAYVEVRSDGQAGLTRARLVSFLADRLPGYMMPATIVLVDALPRLPGLKIDRTRLMQMDADRMAQAMVPINDSLISELVSIFESVLGAVGATPEDNIPSLGGDSLQAVKVAIELEHHFGIAIPADVFEATPSIGELARWLAAQKASPTPGFEA